MHLSTVTLQYSVNIMLNMKPYGNIPNLKKYKLQIVSSWESLGLTINYKN